MVEHCVHHMYTALIISDTIGCPSVRFQKKSAALSSNPDCPLLTTTVAASFLFFPAEWLLLLLNKTCPHGSCFPPNLASHSVSHSLAIIGQRSVGDQDGDWYNSGTEQTNMTGSTLRSFFFSLSQSKKWRTRILDEKKEKVLKIEIHLKKNMFRQTHLDPSVPSFSESVSHSYNVPFIKQILQKKVENLEMLRRLFSQFAYRAIQTRFKKDGGCKRVSFLSVALQESNDPAGNSNFYRYMLYVLPSLFPIGSVYVHPTVAAENHYKIDAQYSTDPTS